MAGNYRPLLAYTAWRCSSKTFPCLDALMYVTASVTGLTIGTRIVIGVPLIILTIIASILLSLFNDMTGKSAVTPQQFQKLIARIYKNRMKQ